MGRGTILALIVFAFSCATALRKYEAYEYAKKTGLKTISCKEAIASAAT